MDASVLVSALGDDSAAGEHARSEIRGQHLVAPELVDLEVVSAWRRAVRAGRLGGGRARQALAELVALPLVRSPHRPLLTRIWELRDNLTPYDAAYVALAEAVESPLLTADRSLARAPHVRCEIKLLR